MTPQIEHVLSILICKIIKKKIKTIKMLSAWLARLELYVKKFAKVLQLILETRIRKRGMGVGGDSSLCDLTEKGNQISLI